MDKSAKTLEAVRNIAMKKAYLPKEIKKYVVKSKSGGSLTIKVSKK